MNSAFHLTESSILVKFNGNLSKGSRDMEWTRLKVLRIDKDRLTDGQMKTVL